MRNVHIGVGLCILVLAASAAALARPDNKPKAGPMTGTWECTAHGTSQGDMSFTLNLQQNGETVTGTVGTSQGDVEITTGTYKKHVLDIHIEIAQGTYRVTGTFKGGQLSGDWSKDQDQKGTWEGKKTAAAKPAGQ